MGRLILKSICSIGQSINLNLLLLLPSPMGNCLGVFSLEKMMTEGGNNRFIKLCMGYSVNRGCSLKILGIRGIHWSWWAVDSDQTHMKYLFSQTVIKTWNALPEHVEMTTGIYRLHGFKGGLDGFVEIRPSRSYSPWRLKRTSTCKGTKLLNTSGRR